MTWGVWEPEDATDPWSKDPYEDYYDQVESWSDGNSDDDGWPSDDIF